jgi:Uma2 family endonuclease
MAMPTTRKVWTLEELHSLPDDGNKYELVRGELFVTPPPTDEHETILARLTALLVPFVVSNHLGLVYHPRAVLRFEGSEAEPDLMVRQAQDDRRADWDTAPTPILVVEVLSGSTRRRDQREKKDLYVAAAIPEYWMVDTERRTITVVRPGMADRVEHERLVWRPRGASSGLDIHLGDVFLGDA